ncbi:hypothetical protein BASA81_012387 [Batrachochytrium salamandrivorans]|nr:hypothetical protein BASA81_012387 [Batrachochytrium salamandrivorans]
MYLTDSALRRHITYSAEKERTQKRTKGGHMDLDTRKLTRPVVTRTAAQEQTAFLTVTPEATRDAIAERFKQRNIEIVCLVEGTDTVTANSFQARHSYCHQDIEYDSQHSSCLGVGQDGGVFYCMVALVVVLVVALVVVLVVALMVALVVALTSVQGPETPQTSLQKHGAVNLLLAFAVATKHHLRNEEGVYFEDLHHLLVHIPEYAPGANHPTIVNLPLEIARQISVFVQYAKKSDWTDVPTTNAMQLQLLGYSTVFGR